MGRVKLFLRGALLIGIWLVASSDVAPVQYGEWTPFFMKRLELDRSVFAADAPRPMINPGKMWVSTDKIYVVERYRGVHVIDNANPAAPRRSGFIVAPGCMDVAIKENVMYLDNAVDLVAFDLNQGATIHRIKNFFPEPASPTGERYYNSSGDLILVGWRQINTEGARR